MNAMTNGLTLPGYEVDKIIYEDPYLYVCYAYAAKRGHPALLKVVKEGSRTIIENAKLLHEYEGTARVPVDGILRPVTVVPHGHALILEYEPVNGVTLRSYFEMQPVSCNEFLELGIGMCRMIEALHQQQVLHLNLKPDTILVQMVTKRIYVTGFGYALFLQQGERQPMKRPLLEGNPIYLSPEQTGRMNCDLGPYSDLYSLGVTWYELLAGELPFEADNALAWSHAHMARRPVPLTERRPELPPELAEIVMRLLEKDPEARYPDARMLRVALEECLEGRRNSRASELPEGTLRDQAAPARQLSVTALYPVDPGPGRILPHPALGQAGDAPLFGLTGPLAGDDSGGYPQTLDLAAVVQSSHCFAEGWEGRGLAEKLLATIVMQAGAGQGYLIVLRQGEPYVEASIDSDNGVMSGCGDFRPCPLSACGDLSQELIQTALQSGEPMLLRTENERHSGGPDQPGPATRPPEAAEGCPASVLVLPLRMHDQVRGCLYLVNGRTGHAFVPGRLGTLHTLACQLLYVAEAQARRLPPSREELQRLAKVEELTAREREVLNLLARGLSNKEIAEELLVSAETVKAHIKNLFKKLGVDRRMKAVSVAKTLGWLDERTP
ncbi:protein kinase domain-containing protein [Paenibacillus thiaminolyticus]|uniref:Protein kinase n=1 Tax=Paenibacillus thiaminolyticus TaxID=49283 RepID=A0AAP9J1V7_PANTH|nr:LuxR C-terminal-related transcriptional regulator [Paenibacillus thiaminolyticus]MEC0064551.1 LuxR C-terminal-related transcriptional regulator [Paenibacillus thiaminolyticus]MEC0104259.1 LuxR C-terminal-related transcriptional regulator [Paenibacillus thiaminolyticus]QDM44814.1 protein kinase [Paenibacillus thiaminolyticus]SUA95824.1 serine/threonine protein kinase with PASTA sensor(s) [Paenibacillus thiaminolyticus]